MSPRPTLVLSTEPVDRPTAELIFEQVKDEHTVVVVTAKPVSSEVPLESRWLYRTLSEFHNEGRWRADFYNFLDRWPSRPMLQGKSHNELFRYRGGYGAWWTSSNTVRIGVNDAFLRLKTAWQCSEAISDIDPGRVVLFTKDGVTAKILTTMLDRKKIEHLCIPTSASPPKSIWTTSGGWLVKTMLMALVTPAALCARTVAARLMVGSGFDGRSGGESPCVVATTAFPRHFYKGEHGAFSKYHDELFAALGSMAPGLQCKLMIYTAPTPFEGSRINRRNFHSGWKYLRGVEGFVTLEQSVPSVCAYLARLPGQVRDLLRNFRLENDPAYRDTLVFAGADVSEVLLPHIRASVANAASWAAAVHSITECLRKAGDVKAILVNEEMYLSGIRYIAAAKHLRIPTIGVQHGSIYPAHLVYTPSKQQLLNTPVCDYFAAFGEYAASVMSELGSYPSERIWITGSPRLDEMSRRELNSTAARKKLGFNSTERVILVATQHYKWFHEAMDSLFEICAKTRNTRLMVKMHPLDPFLEDYRKLAARHNANTIDFFHEDLDTLYAACDVFISGTSTTLLEATILGIRTICVNFSREPDQYPFAEEGPSLGARSRAELEAALDRVSRIPVDEFRQKREAFLNRHLGPTAKGEASISLASKIVRTIGYSATRSC